MKFPKIGIAAKTGGALLTLLALSVGASGCGLLKLALKSQKHAAIAFDEKTGGWGYSYDQLTEDLAKTTATSKCGSCTVRLTWNQGCGALAVSPTKKGVMGVGTSINRAGAEGSARAECLGKSGGACNIAVWACNSK